MAQAGPLAHTACSDQSGSQAQSPPLDSRAVPDLLTFASTAVALDSCSYT